MLTGGVGLPVQVPVACVALPPPNPHASHPRNPDPQLTPQPPTHPPHQAHKQTNPPPPQVAAAHDFGPLFAMLRPKGKLCMVGAPPGKASFDWFPFLMK